MLDRPATGPTFSLPHLGSSQSMDCLRTSLAPLAMLLGACSPLAFATATAYGGDGPPDIIAGIPGGGDRAADAPQKPAEPPLGKYLTVTSPVDDLVFGRVK